MYVCRHAPLVTHSIMWIWGAAGIDAAGLPEDLDIHHLIVNNWEDLEAPQNVCIASIPTVFNASLAPPGKAVVHAYTAGNEPYSMWEGLDRRSQEYKQLKVWTILLDVIAAKKHSGRTCLFTMSSGRGLTQFAWA